MDKNELLIKENKKVKKIITAVTYIIYIIAMFVFEIGYCNASNVIKALSGDIGQVKYNFSLSRIVFYLIFLLCLVCSNSYFIEEVLKTLKYKYKRFFIKAALVLASIILIAAIAVIITHPILSRGMSIGIITVLMGTIFIIYVSNDILKNIIVMSFSFGLVFTITTDFNHDIDEKKHFMSAFNMASGNFDYVDNPITDINVEKLPQLSKFTVIDEFLSNKYEPAITDNVNMEDTPSTPAPNNFVTYLFPAAGIFVAKLLGGSIIDMYIMGRIFNLVLYTILIYIAMKILPFKKNIFWIVFFTPMALLLGATYSIDGFCIGILSILIAYCLKLKKEKETISLKEFIILCVLFALTAFAKSMAYVLIAIIFLMLPIIPTLKKNKKYLPIIIIGAIIAVIVVGGLVLYIKNSKLKVDVRAPGELSVSGQIDNLIHNPIFDIKLAFNHFKDTFLCFYWYTMLHDNKFFTADAPCLLIPILLYILYVSCTEDDYNFKLSDKIIMLISFTGMFATISLVMYLGFTQVGALHIGGVQPRYIIPIISLVLFGMSRDNIVTKNKEDRNMKIAITTGIIMVLGLAQLILG